MTRSASPDGRTGRVLQRNMLWLLAALLGAASIHATARIIHDTSRRRIAAGLVAQSIAEQVVAGMRYRLEVTAARSLAPPPIADAGKHGDLEIVHALAWRHRADKECGCVLTPPASFFFRIATGDEAPHIASWQPANLFLDLEYERKLAERARAWLRDASREPVVGGEPGRHVVQLRLNSSLNGTAAVTAVERDTGGRANAIAGFVAASGELMRFLVDSAEASMDSEPSPGDSNATLARPGTPSTLARLDSHSVEVRDPEGNVVFGIADSSRRFRASVTDSTVLGGASVTVALETWQISSPLIAPIASAQVWHLFVMLLGTIIVIVLAVRSSRREAQLASARSDFIAAVSHELRMPLAQILLASETLAMHRERDERQRQGLASSILREARRLIALVENVLLFSRTGAVELRAHLRPVDVGELFTDVREAVQLAVDDAGNTLETNGSVELTVHGDRTLLRQALVNLLDNAMKYGGASQRIRLFARMADDRVQLIVEDAGRGIPHAERLRVFEPWERLARDQSSERTGTGLGLAVVRQVAAACGGRVWLEEAEGGGTRAILEVPAAPSVDAAVRA